jgi:hypothetical protein
MRTAGVWQAQIKCLLLELPGSSRKEFSRLIDARQRDGALGVAASLYHKKPCRFGPVRRRYCHMVLMFIREQKLEQELFPHER